MEVNLDYKASLFFGISAYVILFVIFLVLFPAKIRHTQRQLSLKSSSSLSIQALNSTRNSSLGILFTCGTLGVMLLLRIISQTLTIHGAFIVKDFKSTFFAVGFGLDLLGYGVFGVLFAALVYQWYLIYRNKFSFMEPQQLVIRTSIIVVVMMILPLPAAVLAILKIWSEPANHAFNVLSVLGIALPCVIVLVIVLFLAIGMAIRYRKTRQFTEASSSILIYVVIILVGSILLRLGCSPLVFSANSASFSLPLMILLVETIPDILFTGLCFIIILRTLRTHSNTASTNRKSVEEMKSSAEPEIDSSEPVL